MSTAPTTSPVAANVPHVRRRFDVAIVALFAISLVVPALGLRRSGVSEQIEQTENRRAARFPDIECRQHGLLPIPRKQTLVNFPHDFEAWFNDHLLGRRSLIRLYNQGTIAGVTTQNLTRGNEGAVRGSEVVIGRDGWLFSSHEMLTDDFRHSRPFTKPQLATWQHVLETRREWLAQRGIRYVVMFGPNQQTIYGEYMPASMTQVHPHSRLDQFMAHFTDQPLVTIVDPRRRLLAGKAHWPTYHKTDTHWNDYGAFLAYQQLCETIQPWFPQLQPAELTDFEVAHRETEGQQLAASVESIVRLPEQLVTLTPKQPRYAQIGPTSWTANQKTDFTVTNPRGELGRVVVLHDSFFEAMMPYVNEDWQHVRYVGVSTEFPAELIEAEQPLLVVQETVERRLMFYEPTNPTSVDMPPVNLASDPIAAPR